MKYKFLLLFALFANISISAQSPVQLVNPFVGTDFHGHTFPGATSPFGMVQLSPDTRLTGWDGCSGYHYSDSTIYGFSHTHLSGTGIADYCDILIMPVSGYSPNIINKDIYKSQFSHKNEVASPGYYEVFLDSWGIKAQLTAGKRVGMHKYTFNSRSTPGIILDLTHRDEILNSNIEIVDYHTVQGYRQSKSWAKDHIVYFYIEFSAPFTQADYPGIDKKSKSKVMFNFDKNVIYLKIGLSSVSEENAKMNLLAEVQGWNFERLKQKTEDLWGEYLNKIEVTSNNIEAKKIFYTALYHTAISPNLYSDVNGEYRGMDRKVHKAVGYDQYTVFSLWDTYRALHPLFTIIEQKRTSDFINSFLAIYDQANKLPIWELSGNETNCMIGYHSVSVIADALMKKIGGFDSSKALEAMINSSNIDEYGKALYIKNGYIPAEGEHESVSKTLEYAYDDWCIAQVAKIKGKKDIYKKYIRRAQSYKNIFDPNTGFMRPKINGMWISPFTPTEVNVHFVEANSWQYSFYVPQDIENHIKLMGGDEKYTAKLDELFSTSNKTTGLGLVDITGLIGQYAHGNEPSHHASYLYSYAGKPWKTQAAVRKILKSLYSSAPDGLCGNDDCGQMSAWYVLSAMGFYPVSPGDINYVLGSPIFSKVEINLESGKKFIINTQHASERNVYINSVSLNGRPYSKSFIDHNILMDSTSLDFVMAPKPNYNYGTALKDRPRSIIRDEKIVINPWFDIKNYIFRDSMSIAIKSQPGNTIWYKIEDTDSKKFIKYTKPFSIKKSSTIYAYSSNIQGLQSFTITAKLNKIITDLKINTLSKYNRMYNAGGDQGLIDGVRGNLNFRLGGWQGYQDTDFSAIIDLGKERSVSSITGGFLQDARSWIWMPQYIEYYTSLDGKEFTSAGRIVNKISPKDYELQIQNLTIDGLNASARYIKVFAKNFGTIPEWHEGAGGESFIFIDEIIVQ